MKNQRFNTSKACEGGLTSTGFNVSLANGFYYSIRLCNKARGCFIPIGYYTTTGGSLGTNLNKTRKLRLNWVKAIRFISGIVSKPSGFLQRRYPGVSTSMWIIARDKAISDKVLPWYFEIKNQRFSPAWLLEGNSTTVFGYKTRLKDKAGNKQGLIKENQNRERGYTYARNQKRVNGKNGEIIACIALIVNQ